MKENKIMLKFEDITIPSLAGYDYGMSVYMEQVEPNINYDADEIIIVFPDYKSKVASSFVEGFFDTMKKNIGLVGIEKKVKVVSPHEKIKNIVKKYID